MTGKQIAKNLRGSRRKWGKGNLYNGETYCVLGIKAAEKGVTPAVLSWFENSDNEFGNFGNLEILTSLNDRSDSKQTLIEKLESEEYATEQFAVEAFVAYLKKAQKKKVHLREEGDEF